MKLKTLREKAGLTQHELANKSGVNIQTLRKYEQGTKNINNARLKTILKLAITLNCNISDILTDNDTIVYLEEYKGRRCTNEEQERICS